MTFKQFAFNNVKRNTRAYLSYFLSCMFAVIVFFMYAVVIFHPQIEKYDFVEVVRRGILVSEVIIYLFSSLFVLYSTATFIKSRKKEYGILTTLGISKSQLNRMLITENTIIGLASIIAGILVGALLTKLFLMIFSAILNTGEILPFYLSWKAIGITVALFFIMFEINSLLVVFTLRTKSIMEVFRGAKAPRKTPRFSWIISILAIAAVFYAYYLAYTADMFSILYRMFIILVLIIPGTYFLFTQFSIAFTSLLRKNKRFLYQNLNLLIISDLTYKLKDNARLLSMVAILSAVAFTSSGVLYGLFQSMEEETERFVPQDFSIITKGTENKELFEESIAKAEKIFTESFTPFESVITLPIQAKSQHKIGYWNDISFTVFSYADYKKMLQLNNLAVPNPPGNGYALVLVDDIIRPSIDPVPKRLTFRIGNEQIEQHVTVFKNKTMNSTIYGMYTLVLPDATFKKYQQKGEQLLYYTAKIPNWEKHIKTVEKVQAALDQEHIYTDSRASTYTGMKEGVSYLFFFGIFISVLFFLAAGSILYFRMYQEIDKDIKYYYSLYRIGLTNQEMRQIATRQLAFLFFLPFLIAVVHAGFAFKTLQNILVSSVLLPSIYIILFYFIVHFINFIFIRNIYISKLKRVM
ncbi:ABC transporter permease [Cerasibacillus sp. JNUCC 74]